jgi:hypothetical protein
MVLVAVFGDVWLDRLVHLVGNVFFVRMSQEDWYALALVAALAAALAALLTVNHKRLDASFGDTTAPQAELIAGLHRQRFAIAVAAGLGVLATFLPWVHAPIVGSVLGTAGDGWITLALFLPALLLAFRGDRHLPLRGIRRMAATIPAGLAALIGLEKIDKIRHAFDEIPQDNVFAQVASLSTQIGVGIYLLIAAGFGLVALSWGLAKYSKKESNRVMWSVEVIALLGLLACGGYLTVNIIKSAAQTPVAGKTSPVAPRR